MANNKSIELCYSEINLNVNINLSATQLRSYIGYRFFSDTEFHHHDDQPYRYPLIQYKRIHHKLYVLGIGKYSNIVFDRISGLQYIVIPRNTLPITNIFFNKTTYLITDDVKRYKFLSPWIALNSKNYSKFKNLNKYLKKRFLENILTANLLSMLKGLGIKIDYDLYVAIKWYKEKSIIAHKHNFAGFFAEFVTNLSLPKYIGIGKSISKGFGIIDIINSKSNDSILNQTNN